MKGKSRKLVAPDGGWGWMVCLGTSLIAMMLRSLDPSFGLLFGDLLKELKVDTAQAAAILSGLDAVFSFSGLFVGPLIKRFTCRKVAVFGSLLSCTGLLLTSQANSVTYIICTYSILGGLGTGLAFASSFVSLNRYFTKRRTQAVGLSMAGTSLGSMCMPQIVRLLLAHYDFRGTVLILGALALHAVAGSLLFQPVSWHLVPAPDEKDLKSLSKNVTEEDDALLSKDHEVCEAKKNEKDKKETRPRKFSTDTSNLELATIDMTQNHWKDEGASSLVERPDENGSKNGNKKDEKKSFVAALVSFFDLNLLKSPVYLNLVLGLSLVFAADMNFKFITPFFLSNIGMSRTDVALALSLTAFSDVVAKLTMPTIFTILKFKNRKVFWIGAALLGINRSVMAQLMPGKILMALLAVNGFLRGITTANFNLCVSENCTLDLLPSALGIMNVSRGLFIVTLGPFVGYIRDVTGSYEICIHTLTSFIASCFVIWGIEFGIKGIRGRGNPRENQVLQNT